MKNPPFIHYQKDSESEIRTEYCTSHEQLRACIKECEDKGYIIVETHFAPIYKSIRKPL